MNWNVPTPCFTSQTFSSNSLPRLQKGMVIPHLRADRHPFHFGEILNILRLALAAHLSQ